MKRCDLFYEKEVEKENWEKDNLCDQPTDPREGIHILIEELLGKDWYVVMPKSDNQVITQAIYQIIYKYVDEPKKKRLPLGDCNYHMFSFERNYVFG